MTDKDQKQQFSVNPPISAMLATQGSLSSGNKFTNVFMPNQQQAIMEYVSEPYIAPEIEARYPMESMLIKKRALGNETEIESWLNDLEFNFIKLLKRIGYVDLAEMEMLTHLYHREGQRTHLGFERDHQVMQKTLTSETLTTFANPKKQGFWSKLGNFGSGNKPQQAQQQVTQQ